ncbi:MAG: hypothetical protein WCT18_02400 [Patescibacteria group bacterium]
MITDVEEMEDFMLSGELLTFEQAKEIFGFHLKNGFRFVLAHRKLVLQNLKDLCAKSQKKENKLLSDMASDFLGSEKRQLQLFKFYKTKERHERKRGEKKFWQTIILFSIIDLLKVWEVFRSENEDINKLYEDFSFLLGGENGKVSN